MHWDLLMGRWKEWVYRCSLGLYCVGTTGLNKPRVLTWGPYWALLVSLAYKQQPPQMSGCSAWTCSLKSYNLTGMTRAVEASLLLPSTISNEMVWVILYNWGFETLGRKTYSRELGCLGFDPIDPLNEMEHKPGLGWGSSWGWPCTAGTFEVCVYIRGPESSSEFPGLDVHLRCSQYPDSLRSMQTPTFNSPPFTVIMRNSSPNFHRTQKNNWRNGSCGKS